MYTKRILECKERINKLNNWLIDRVFSGGLPTGKAMTVLNDIKNLENKLYKLEIKKTQAWKKNSRS